MLKFVKEFLRKIMRPTRDAERYLAKSVDRADFERREQQLKYKGYL